MNDIATIENSPAGQTVPRIYDRELNAAILVLADQFIPRGWQVTPVAEMNPEAVWKSCEDGRPLVFDRAGHSPTSIFGDVEIELAFQALTQFFMYTPPVAHPSHRPNLCAAMMVGGFDRLMDAIVELYGDDERTQRWRKAIWTHTVGRLAFLAVGNYPPADTYDFVVRTLAAVDPNGTEPVNELRDGFVAMYTRAEQTRDAIIGILRAATQERETDDVNATAASQGVVLH